VGVDVADRLVGERGDLALEVGIDARADGCRLVCAPLLDPLRLDRRVGPEAERAVPQPAGDLEAEEVPEVETPLDD